MLATCEVERTLAAKVQFLPHRGSAYMVEAHPVNKSLPAGRWKLPVGRP